MFLLMKIFYCLLQFYLSSSFLFHLLLHDLGSFHHCFPSGQVFLHEAQTLILLEEVHQLVFDDCFDLFIRILLQILLCFGLLALRLLLNALHGGVHDGNLHLGWWLFHWLSGSSGFCGCRTRLDGCL
jgi:hypothetical protein